MFRSRRLSTRTHLWSGVENHYTYVGLGLGIQLRCTDYTNNPRCIGNEVSSLLIIDGHAGEGKGTKT